MNQRKLGSILIPVAVGATILLALNFFTRPRTIPRPVASAPAVVPPNPAHEKAALEEQLKTNPKHAPILLRLAELERAAGRHDAAMDYLKRASGDTKSEDALLELGKALYEAGDIDGALRETKRLVDDHPNNVDGLYNLGAIYANRNQVDLARQFWTRAVAANATSESGRKARDGLNQIGR